MIANHLVQKLQKFKGPVFVEISNFNDTMYVQAVKKDLILHFSDRFISTSETGFELDDHGYLSKDYDSLDRS